MRLLKLFAYDIDGKTGMFDNRSYKLIYNGSMAGFASRNPADSTVEVVIPAASELGLEVDSGAPAVMKVLDNNSIHVITLGDGGDYGQNTDYIKLFRSGWTEF